MIRMIITTAVILVILLACSAGETRKLSGEKRHQDEKNQASAHKMMIFKYEKGKESLGIPPRQEDLDSLTAQVISLFRVAETYRVSLDDEEMNSILERKTGIALRFSPGLEMPFSDNLLDEIMLLTEGEYANSSRSASITFFAAIDGEDFIRSPFIAHDTAAEFQLIRELLE